MSQLGPGVKALMALHALSWLLIQPFQDALPWLILSPDVWQGEVWRLLSYHLVLPTLNDLLWMMVGLYFFAPGLERRMGTGRFLTLYVSSALISGVVFALLMQVVPRSGVLAGPSPADMAVLAAFARLAPQAQVLFMFVLPVRSVHLLLFVLAMRVLQMWQVQTLVWPLFMDGVGAAVGWLALTDGGRWLDRLNPAAWWQSRRQRKLLKDLKVIDGGRRGPDQWVH